MGWMLERTGSRAGGVGTNVVTVAATHHSDRKSLVTFIFNAFQTITEHCSEGRGDRASCWVQQRAIFCVNNKATQANITPSS